MIHHKFDMYFFKLVKNIYILVHIFNVSITTCINRQISLDFLWLYNVAQQCRLQSGLFSFFLSFFLIFFLTLKYITEKSMLFIVLIHVHISFNSCEITSLQIPGRDLSSWRIVSSLGFHPCFKGFSLCIASLMLLHVYVLFPKSHWLNYL